MSRKREIARRIAALRDISGIMSAMKSLALMETRILGNFLQRLERMVAGIEAAAADFLKWNGEFAAAPGGMRELCVLVGSEQGFCGDFNDSILERAGSILPEQAQSRWIVVGRRLAARVADDPRVLLTLSGATVADEVSAVLLHLSEEVGRLLVAGETADYGLSVLSHCDEANDILLHRLLPLRCLPPPPTRSHPPELNLPPAGFFRGLLRQYLHAKLNEALYNSLMAENRKRLTHMDRALQRLDEKTARLRLAYNAERQEEIVEEIEILLLSAEALTEDPRHGDLKKSSE